MDDLSYVCMYIYIYIYIERSEFSDLRYVCMTCKQKHQANYLLGKSLEVPARDSPFVSVSETNTSVVDQHKLNLAVINLDKRLSSMRFDFKALYQEITQKFLALTAQLSSATSPSSSSVQILASNANNDAVGQLSQSSSCVQQHLIYAKAVTSDVVKSVVTQVIEEQRKVDNLNSTIVVYGFPDDHNDDYSELVSMFDFLQCHCEIVRYSSWFFENTK